MQNSDCTETPFHSVFVILCVHFLDPPAWLLVERRYFVLFPAAGLHCEEVSSCIHLITFKKINS